MWIGGGQSFASTNYKHTAQHYYCQTIIMNICRYFIEGTCKYGDSCFYAHDMKYMQYCRFYQAGNCRNGGNCRFKHSAPPPPPAYGNKSEQREVTRTISNPQDDEKSPLSRVDAAMAILLEKSQGVARVPCVVGVGRKESLNKRTCLVPSGDILNQKHCKMCCIRKSLIEIKIDPENVRFDRKKWRDVEIRSVVFKCHDDSHSVKVKQRALHTGYSYDELAIRYENDIGGLVKVFTGKEWKWIWWSPEHSIPLSRRVAGARAVAEIQAISLAIAQAVQTNTKQIQVETDSQFVLNAVRDWMTGLNDVNGDENKEEGPKLACSLKSLLRTSSAANLEIEWNHVLGSANNEAIEQAEKLANIKQLHKRLQMYNVAGLGDEVKSEDSDEEEDSDDEEDTDDEDEEEDTDDEDEEEDTDDEDKEEEEYVHEFCEIGSSRSCWGKPWEDYCCGMY